MNKYKKLALTFITMISILYCTGVVGNYATCRDIEANLPPIYDVLHDNTYVVSILSIDIMLIIINIGLFSLVFYLLKYNLEKVIILFNNISLLYGFRIITIFSKEKSYTLE